MPATATTRPRAPERTLPIHGTGRPAPWPLVASCLLAACFGWLAAAAALIPGAASLAAGRVGVDAPVLAAHLAALVFFPFAVTGAAWHLLPVMLRNSLPSRRRRRAVPLLLAGGFLLAPGVATGTEALAWPGAALLAGGLVLVLADLGALVLRAPRGKTLVASRTGVALSALHGALAFALGAATFATAGPELLGVSYERLVLVHLTIAVVGWLALLVVAVGRTLVPMLALAPAPSPRRGPYEELFLTAGLWLLVPGLAFALEPLAVAGILVAFLALASFGREVAGAVLRRRAASVAGPLAHLLAGAAFLVEGTALALAGLLGGADPRRAAAACVFLLLAGWAAGVLIGHAGKLLSLSAWVWWPPGPRPKQEALYPRRAWQVEALAFAAAVQLVTAGILVGSAPAARAGAALLCASALLVLGGALATVHRTRAGS